MTDSATGSTQYLRELADSLEPEMIIGPTDAELCRAALRAAADRRERPWRPWRQGVRGKMRNYSDELAESLTEGVTLGAIEVALCREALRAYGRRQWTRAALAVLTIAAAALVAGPRIWA